MYAAHRRSLVVTGVLPILVFLVAGPVHAICVDIVTPRTDPAEVMQYELVPFEAVCYSDRGDDLTEKASFIWQFGDTGASQQGNPTEYRFNTVGKYVVTVTARLDGSEASDQVTVIVTSYDEPLPRQAADDFEFFAVVYTGKTYDGDATVCGEVDLVCRARPEGQYAFNPWDFDHVWIQRRDDQGQWQTVYDGPPEFNEISNHEEYSTWEGDGEWWSTPAEPNDVGVEWRAKVHLSWGIMGEMTLTLDAVTWTPENGVVKATGDDIILHHADDTSHTIAWNIIHHVDDGVDPRFTVTVDIYDLQGNSVAQLTQEHVEAGEGELAWDTDLPEESGVYAYRISAEHEHPGIVVCGPEPDTSWRLEISDVDFTDLVFDSRELTLSGELCYTLNRDAGMARLRVFDPDLNLVGTDGTLPAASGQHTYEFSFGVNADPVTPYWFVLDAEETAEDGQDNRDGEPKPAVAKGAWVSLPIRAYNFRGALYSSASQIIDQASQQQIHPPQGEFYPAPAYTVTNNKKTWRIKMTYNRLADYDLNGNHNPTADALVFYIGHGAEGVMLIGDGEPDGVDEIWTGAGPNDDVHDCYYMDNFGADAIRRALVAVVAACRSADDRPADWPNGPRESVMDAFHNQGAGCAIGYHGGLSEDVAETFCNHFWLVSSKQCAVYFENGEEVHVPRETTIQMAFDEARMLSGTPDSWECVGAGAATCLRPAAYGGAQ